MIWKCRKENRKMQDCLKAKLVIYNALLAMRLSFCCHRFNDPDINEKCRQEYLQEREEFRRTGVRKKMKRLH